MRHHSVFLNLYTKHKKAKLSQNLANSLMKIKQLFKADLLNLTLNVIDIYIWANRSGLQSGKRNWYVFWAVINLNQK